MVRTHHKVRTFLNGLLEIIQQRGLAPEAFELEHSLSQDGHLQRILIRYKPNQDFFFRYFRYQSLGFLNIGMAMISPAMHRLTERFFTNGAERIYYACRKWLDAIEAEESIPDRWAELFNAKPPEAFQEGLEAANEPYLKDEIEQIGARLKIIESKMAEQFQLDGEQTDFVRRELAYLSEKAKAKGITKKDWKLLFLATMMNIVTTLALDPAKTSALWQLAGEVMANIAGFLPPIG